MIMWDIDSPHEPGGLGQVRVGRSERRCGDRASTLRVRRVRRRRGLFSVGDGIGVVIPPQYTSVYMYVYVV